MHALSARKCPCRAIVSLSFLALPGLADGLAPKEWRYSPCEEIRPDLPGSPGRSLSATSGSARCGSRRTVACRREDSRAPVGARTGTAPSRLRVCCLPLAVQCDRDDH